VNIPFMRHDKYALMLFVGSRQKREREREREREGGEGDTGLEERNSEGVKKERPDSVIYENRGGIIIFLSPSSRPFRTSPVDGTLANNKKGTGSERYFCYGGGSGASPPPPSLVLPFLPSPNVLSGGGGWVNIRFGRRACHYRENHSVRVPENREEQFAERSNGPRATRGAGFLGAFGENFRSSLNTGGPSPVRENRKFRRRDIEFTMQVSPERGRGRARAIRCCTRLNGGEVKFSNLPRETFLSRRWR